MIYEKSYQLNITLKVKDIIRLPILKRTNDFTVLSSVNKNNKTIYYLSPNKYYTFMYLKIINVDEFVNKYGCIIIMDTIGSDSLENLTSVAKDILVMVEKIKSH